MTNKMHTLEKIVDKLGNKFDEERVHTAMLLAYTQSIYDIMRIDSVPSPLYRIAYDETNNVVSIEETYGKSLVPKKNALDITLEDEILCCNLRDMPLLLEGETGVGKTYAAVKYVNTAFKKENYFMHRLSANVFLNNLFSHFQEGKIINGMPVIMAKEDIIEKTAAGIVDEINRGDSNETLQLFDNEMNLGGRIYKLGIPVPEIEIEAGKLKFIEKSSRLKKLLIITAQNPSNADDAKFTQTMQLDAAVDNRLLKTYVGNAAPSAGTSLWLVNESHKSHYKFLEKFKERTGKYLGLENSVLEELEGDWLSTYAWITESKRTDKPILYSALELSDLIIATFSGNLIDYFNYEKRIINDWELELKKGVEITEELQETERVKKIHEITDSFKVPIIFRDIVQIKKIADVLATLKNIKDALNTDNPVQEYMKAKKYVTVREVAGAASLLAINKQKSKSQSPVNSINDVLNHYIALVEEYSKEAKLFSTSFDLTDPHFGIKKIAVYKSLKETVQLSKGVEYLIDKISDEAKTLKSKISATDEIKNILIIRSIGDLMTFCGFLEQYKGEMEGILKNYTKKPKVNEIINEISSFYYKKQRDTAVTMPEIYQHRIQRTLG